MPIDPSIALNVRPWKLTQPDPIERYAKIAGLHQAMGNQEIQALQLERARQEMADEAATREAFASAGGDRQRTIDALMGRGLYKPAQSMQKAALEEEEKRANIRSKLATAGKSEFEVTTEKLARGASILSTARDQQSYDAARRQLALTFGPEAVSGMPERFDPGYVQSKIAEGQTIAQRLQDERSREQQAETRRSNLARETETGRHNIEAERTARGNLAVAQGNLGVSRGRLSLDQEKARDAKDPAVIQREAEARATGKELGESRTQAQVNLPQAAATAERALRLVDALVGSEDGRVKRHPGFSGAVGATMLPGARFVPGTDAADFSARMDELKGGQFLQAFESLKGGGQITEVEGKKATEAISRMSLSQSEREFVTAAREFQDVVRKGLARAKQKAGQGRSVNPSSLSDDELRRELNL